MSSASSSSSLQGLRLRRRVAALEEQDGQVADAEVDEAAGLVRQERAEVCPHDALPPGPVGPIKLLLMHRRD